MKTHTNEKGETVIEYSFKAWEEGLLFDTRAPYTNRKVTNRQSGQVTLYTLPTNEHAMIQEASKALYKKKVIARAVSIRDAFYKRLTDSEAKETLIQQEIEKCEAILLPTKEKAAIIFNNEHPIKGVHYTATQIAGIKDLYQKLIIEGNRDYSVVSHPNCHVKVGVGDFWHIETEALFRFYSHLKNFDLDAFLRNDPPFINGTRVPLNVFLENSGAMVMLNKYGAIINPTHNFKKLLEVRQGIYEKRKAGFVADNEFNQVTLDKDDWEHFNRLHWELELETVINWIAREKERVKPSTAHLVQLNKYKGYVEQQLAMLQKTTKPKPKEKVKAPPQTLRGIWQGTQKDYDKLIKLLKADRGEIGGAFVTEIKGKLQWNKLPAKGFAQYIAGLFFVLIDKNWITSNHTAPELVSIFSETFDFRIDSTPLKSIATNPPDKKYTKLFLSLGSNLG